MIDKIDRTEIVEKMEYLIETLPHNHNFCLALNGTWGSGKSFVIELLKEKLLEHSEYIVVHYDAWKNSFYSDPLIAMLYSILDTLENNISEEVSDAVVSTRTKQTALTVVSKVGEAVLDSVAEKSKIVGFIKIAIQKVKDVIKIYKKTALTNNCEFEDYKSYISFLNQTIKQLNDITALTLLENKQTRFVVLVDEIDRCLPNDQLIVLERLHHLFDVQNCAVIVALNKEAIHENFEKNYGGNSDDYLRKFFQYNFELPTNAIVLLKNWLVDVFYEINDRRKEPILEDDVKFIIDDIEKVAKDILIDNKSKKVDNRDIEKYINVSKRVIISIIDFHPAFILFTLRLMLYRMFKEDLFNELINVDKNNSSIKTQLDEFLGVKNAHTSYSFWNYG